MPVTSTQTNCYHCGGPCISTYRLEQKPFCCEGCRFVYQLLNKNGLCKYYELNDRPAAAHIKPVRKDKFLFLDDSAIQQRLISFKDERQTRVTFYLPQIHCSSCLWLLENLHKLHRGVISARVHFTKKEVELAFDHQLISLRQTAELLTGIGYEPWISLSNLQLTKPRLQKSMIYQLGVAGFCFSNIMLMSFPEYLGLDAAEKGLQGIFRTLNFILALPVLLYSTLPFYKSAWKGMQKRILNIDAPIVLAVLITFGRSVYELLTGAGGGYFDSMSGIVFFMLAGRVLQEKTHQHLSFERDYTSYFPIAVTVLKNGTETPAQLPDIKPGDTLLIHYGELIPADGIITRGRALVDYSFVTGEAAPTAHDMGEMIYAGGKQTGGNMELLVMREVAQGYLTSLWNNTELRQRPAAKGVSFVHRVSRWFTAVLFVIAVAAAAWWSIHDSGRVWNVITAVLIIACPCALLLSNSFTNGNILGILSRRHFYLRNAGVIEELARATHIVFDKTGTLTSTRQQHIRFHGPALSGRQQECIAALAAQSSHPLSMALVKHLGRPPHITVQGFKEEMGKGIEGLIEGELWALGTAAFTGSAATPETNGSKVYIAAEGKPLGYFEISHPWREELPALLNELKGRYGLSVLSGDHDGAQNGLQQLMGPGVTMLFRQSPQDKLCYIQQLQHQGQRVVMVGDGLNDAGALLQAHAGIALAEDTNNFTPASDGILEAKQLPLLGRMLRLCRDNKRIVVVSFIVSILYNIIGLYFAVMGLLSPLVAAILMPASSLSILLITYGGSSWAGRRVRVSTEKTAAEPALSDQ